MKVCIILAGKTDFSVERATAVDLYVHHYALASRFKCSTIVAGDARGRPLPDVEFFDLQESRRAARLRAILDVVAGHRSSILVVHQNAAIADALAHMVNRIPLIFVQHALIDPGASWKSYFLRKRYHGFAHILCASATARQQLINAMPDLAGRISAAPSALDMQQWTPAQVRAKRILVVGRCIPQKGIREAALAIRESLPALTDWSAEFILTLPHRSNAYAEAVLQMIAAMGPRAQLATNVPFPVVKTANEHAAIAVVPSFGAENFARTALEAHAGGAALISSGNGALKEVSGDFACYVDPGDTAAMTQAIRRLAGNEGERNGLAQGGARRARELFDIRHTAPKMDDLLEKLSVDTVPEISGSATLAYLMAKYLR